MSKEQNIRQRIKRIFQRGISSAFKAGTSVSLIRSSLIRVLGLKKSGSWNSAYNDEPLVLPNGKTLTIRIGDHPAGEAQFVAHNSTDYNISILLGKRVDELIIGQVLPSSVYSEIAYRSSCFEPQHREQTLTEILQGLENALETGIYTKGEMGEWVVGVDNTITTNKNNTMNVELAAARAKAIKLKLLQMRRGVKTTELSGIGSRMAKMLLSGDGLDGTWSENRNDFKKKLIDEITTSLFGKWTKPWKPAICMNKKGEQIPLSSIHGRPYTGRFNLLLLSKLRIRSPYFATVAHVLKSGGKITDKNKITFATGYVPMVDIDGNVFVAPKDTEADFVLPSVSKVISTDFVTGIKIPFFKFTEFEKKELNQYIEAFIAAIKRRLPPLYYDQADRCYYTTKHEIHLVDINAFEKIEGYYSTLFHECIHSTMKELGRKKNYAAEELVAEMGATILCAELGLEYSRQNSITYLKGWLQGAMRKTSRTQEQVLIEAYGLAVDAVEYLIGDVDISALIPKTLTDRAIANSQEAEEKPKVKEEPKTTNQPKAKKKTSAMQLVDMPLKDLDVDLTKFPVRFNKEFNDTKSEIIKLYKENKFDWDKFEPIVVWLNPQLRKYYIISGEARVLAIHEISKENPKFSTIPARIFEGTEMQARRYSKKVSVTKPTPIQKPTEEPKAKSQQPKAKEEPKAKSQQPKATEQPKPTEPSPVQVVNMPIEDVYTDPRRFQNRTNAYSNESKNRIVDAYKNKKFDWSKFDPITVWYDPKMYRYFVISGHSRRKAIEEISKENPKFSTIPTRIFEGTEAQAIDFALNSNTHATRETEIERAGYYNKQRTMCKLKKSGVSGLNGMGCIGENSIEAVNATFNNELQQMIDGTLPKNHVFALGYPSAPLLSAGIPDLPIEMAGRTLLQKSDKEYKSQHPFELSDLKNLPTAIANPIAVFKSETGIERQVILTELRTNRGVGFICVLGTHTNRTAVLVNSIISIYPKSSSVHIAKWFLGRHCSEIGEDLLLWVDKEKALKWNNDHSSYVNAVKLSS